MKHVIAIALLAGCSDGAPSCDQMVKSLEQNLKPIGLPVYITATQCETDAFSASLRTCFSKVKGQRGLEACATAATNSCFSKASKQSEIDRCMSKKQSLADSIDDAASSLRLSRDKTLRVIEDYDNSFDRWIETKPGKKCPESLEQLTDNDGRMLDTRDDWGTPFVMKCDERDFWVLSAGPDRVAGTKDDLDSSQVDEATHRPRQKP